MACLDSLGLDELTKENYFAELMARVDEEGSPAEISMDEESDAASVNEELEEKSPEGPGQSVQIQPDRSWVPFPPSSLSYFLNFTYCRSPDEDDIMTSDFDEAALERELEEEERLNSEDKKTSKQYERNLWKAHAHIAP